MIYRANFIIWSLVTIGWIILNLIFYQVLYLNVEEIAGWSKPQVLIVLGFYFIFDFILWGLIWQNMQQIPEKINRGTLDLELIKPINQQFLLSFRSIGFDDFHSLLIGIIIIIYALNLGNIKPTIPDILQTVLALLIAFIYVYAGWFSTICLAFWFDRIDNLHFLFPSLRHFWRVPQPFYKGILRGILTFVIPATLVTTVPAKLLLDQPALELFLILVFFAIATLLFSSWFFKFSLKRYSSASS